MLFKESEIRDVSFAEYRKIEASNWSSFKHAARSASWAKFKNEVEPVKGSVEGRLVHCLALDPGSFSHEFVVAPFDDFRTKAAREWRDSQTADVITQDQFDHCSGVVDAVKASPLGTMLLPGSRNELTIVAVVEHRGREWPVKCRLDLLAASGLLVDLKTTDALTADEFVRNEARKLNYIGQAALYFEMATAAGLDPKAWGWLCVNLKTFDVFGVSASDTELAAGSALWRTALGRWLDAKASGAWPGAAPNDSFQPANLPEWYLDNISGDEPDGGDDE